ncbi:MAG: lysophospholipid acyltransferase family protein [Pseudomonadota bacterium]
MIVLRSIVFNIAFYLWVALVFLLALPLLLLPRRYIMWFPTVACGGALWLLRVCAGVTHEIRGLENYPKGPVLIASKHQSAWDTIIYQYLWSDVAFVLKRELTYLPIYGQFIKKFGMIPIDRKSSAQTVRKLVVEGKRVLDERRKIIIFPEGRRTPPGQSQKYQRGIVMLYEHLNVPVVPVALNSGVFWPRRTFLKRPGTIVLEFLPKIGPGLTRDDFMKELTNSIETASNQLINSFNH